MKTRKVLKAFAVTLASVMTFGTSANSVGFDDSAYDVNFVDLTVTVTLVYDFTDFAMFGGGLDVTYDTSALEFVSYTQAELPPDAQAPASPIGSLTQAGLYQGAGIGTFEFFNGITSAGTIGTFVFNLIGTPGSGNSPCGLELCLTVNSINPFVSLAGEDVSAELLSNGINAATTGHNLPVPAAVWFMLSGLGALVGFGRKSKQDS